MQKSCVSTKAITKNEAALQKWFKNNEYGSQVSYQQLGDFAAHALKNPFYQVAIYDKAQKKAHRTHPRTPQ